MIEVKPGVSVIAWHPAIHYAMIVTAATWNEITGTRLVVTGGSEGKHSARSFHYGRLPDERCRAFDFRTVDPQTGLRLLSSEQQMRMHQLLLKRLGSDFDIVWESRVPHGHIEWDPDWLKET